MSVKTILNMRDIDTSLLRTFITLAETQNFTHTARRIHRSQSATSMQISKLEQTLGCVLFERNKRKVKLTAAGEQFLGYAQQIIQLADEAFMRLEDRDIEGEIRIGVTEDFVVHLLPPILAGYSKAHPMVLLTVNSDLTPNLIHYFENKKYDLIIIKENPGNGLPGTRPLLDEELVWVSANHDHHQMSLAKVRRKLAEEIDPLPLVLSPAPCIYRERAIEALSNTGIPWKEVCTSTSYAGILAAITAGVGITVLPRHLVPDTIIPLKHELGWPELDNTRISLLASSQATPAVKSMISFIEESISTTR